MKAQTGNHTLAISFFLLVLTFTFTIFGYFLLDKPSVTFLNSPFQMVDENLSPGTTPAYTVISCNHRSDVVSYEMHQRIQSLDANLDIDLGTSKIMIEPGCNKAIMLLKPIPEDLPPGRYRLIGNAEIQGNMRKHEVDWFSQPFVVTN